MSPPPTIDRRLVLAVIGLAAFLVMHGLTMPAGHMTSASSAMAATSTTPSTSPGTEHPVTHDMPGASHDEAAQSCIAVVLVAAVVTLLVRSGRAQHAPHQSSTAMFVAAPEPPVPRMAHVF